MQSRGHSRWIGFIAPVVTRMASRAARLMAANLLVGHGSMGIAAARERLAETRARKEGRSQEELHK